MEMYDVLLTHSELLGITRIALKGLWSFLHTFGFFSLFGTKDEQFDAKKQVRHTTFMCLKHSATEERRLDGTSSILLKSTSLGLNFLGFGGGLAFTSWGSFSGQLLGGWEWGSGGRED